MAPRIEIEPYDNGPTLTLTVGGCLDIASATELRDLLLSLLTPPRDVLVDLGAVERMDGAGLQILLAAKAHVERDGKSFAVGTPSEVAARAIAVSGADTLLNPGAAAPVN